MTLPCLDIEGALQDEQAFKSYLLLGYWVEVFLKSVDEHIDRSLYFELSGTGPDTVTFVIESVTDTIFDLSRLAREKAEQAQLRVVNSTWCRGPSHFDAKIKVNRLTIDLAGKTCHDNLGFPAREITAVNFQKDYVLTG